MTRGLLNILFAFIITSGFCQDSDTTVVQDSVLTEELNDLDNNVEVEVDKIYWAPADSSSVSTRSFDSTSLDRFKADPDMNYKLPPTVAESLWDRFLRWLAQLIDKFFDGAVHTNWGRVITYIVGLALLVVLIMLMLKVNAFKVIYSADGGAKKYNVFDENIHEMDFEKLINEAKQSEDYRKGVRLLFLYALKLLSDKHLISWQSGKTNHDYVGEINEKELKTGLNELSFYFDYAWYGNFSIDQETFSKAQTIFSNWKNRIK
jgi:hypothetical protein